MGSSGKEERGGDRRGGRKIGNEELKIMYLNAQSILKKIDELRANVNVLNADVIIIVEAWTNDTISDKFLCIKDYELLERKDRNDTTGGRGEGEDCWHM